MTLSERLKFAMQSAGVSQAELARACGVKPPSVHGWLSGKAKFLRGENLLQAALVLKVRPEWLATDDGDMLSTEAIDVPSRWVDDPLTIKAPDTAVSRFDAETVHIPYYDTGGAMGHGIVLRDQPGVIREMSVSKEWLQGNVRGYTSADNLCLVTGFGDSMRPLFMSGDPVIVDKGVTEFRGDGLYFFRVEGEGFIKRLQSIPGRGLVVISENPSYESWNIDKSTTDFQVLGKVIKAWCGCDF